MSKGLLDSAKELLPETVRLRRAIHREPELAFEEEKTAVKILAALAPLGLSVRSGVAGTGILADLVVDPKGPFIALRADMDALPIQEENDADYASRIPGKAHMCGHDSHMAMLVAAARILAERKGTLRKNVRFLFQPSEEKPPGGAPEMIKAGALDGVEAVYGLHVDPRFPVGVAASRVGPMLAQSDRFDIVIEGRGGHGSMPAGAIDPIPVAASLVTALQTIPSRKSGPADPIVLSVCRFRAGDTFNVIPPRAELAGTVRTMRPETARQVPAWLRQMAESIAAASGAVARVQYASGYPPVVNHASGVARVEAACADLGKEEGRGGVRFVEAEPTMYGEDFAYYLQKVPGAFVFLGCGNPEGGVTEPCHSPKFRIDEQAMALGPALLARLILG